MFNFMKKGVGVGSSNSSGSNNNDRDRDNKDRDEKEKRKREKKLRKELKSTFGSNNNSYNVTGSMSSEDLLRLDEVRRSLKIRGRKQKEKLPSGITADYSEFFANLDIDRTSNTDSIELDRGNEEILDKITIIDRNTKLVKSSNSTSTKLNLTTSLNTYNTDIHSISNTNNYLPPVPPKPPKRGILKGSRSNITNIHEEIIPISSPDSKVVLMRNTLQNEMLFEGLQQANNSIELKSNSLNPICQQHYNSNNLNIITSPSSAESLTDTTNSSFATPPQLSPIGESQGFNQWSHLNSFDLHLPLPKIELVKLPEPRILLIKRQKSPRNDFGFSLRKAICLDRSESLLSPTFKPVIFAEPGAGGGASGLLPGDRLIKVNDIAVVDLPREQIIEMIRNSGDSVKVEVQPVSELVELSRRMYDGNDKDNKHSNNIEVNCNTLKRSASKRFKQDIQHTDDIKSSDENVWLVHRGGFTIAKRLQSQNEINSDDICNDSKIIKIKLLHNGEEITIDEDDIENANPIALDLIEDLCQLKHLNESSVLHVLRQRFASNLIHTKAGPILCVVNPMAPLSLYSEKVVSMFRGCKTEDMPPHIYSMAQTALRTMLETRRDQSLIFMGRSGSGKTTCFKHALYYLSLAAGSVNKLLTAEKVNAINTILEAFGNTKTLLNLNATRFTQILSLDFDHSGQIASASIQVLLLERSRASKRNVNEHSFHILTRLLAGAEGMLQKELHLENISPEDNNPFISLSQKLEDRQKAGAEFIRAQQAFETLNIDNKAVRGIWHILAAIYHLGVAGVNKIGTGLTSRIQFNNPSAARKAANLLGVSLEDLLAAAFPTNSSGTTSPAKSPTETVESWESLEGLVIGLYTEAMAAVVALINKAICTSAHTIASILLIDTPGFQNPGSCGVQSGASLTDLRHNYLQERLQLLFHHMTLVAPKDRYAQELVEIDAEGLSETHSGPLISLIDKAPQNHVVRTSQRDLREQDRRGLLWLLDEESMYPNSNDDTFLERLFSHYGDREHQSLIRKAAAPKQFILQHFQGTNPVLYSANGWLKASREHSAIKNASILLQDSSKDEINRLYVGNLTRGSGIVFCGSIAGLDGTQSLRRVSSIRRSFTSAGVKRNSIMLQVKFTVDGIIDTLRRTGTHFVHCYLLQHNAGTHSVINVSPNNSIQGTEEMVNIPLLRSQVRGSQLIEAARLHRLGFPETVPLNEFIRRFGLLGDTSIKENSVEEILTTNEIDASTYRIGPSQVLFRSGILNQLEAKRDELLSDRIIQLQSYCRGYLARRRVAQRRIQELAVRCIQRNVKAFLAVRDWPWWRLLVRVTPLLNVHRTEEQLKIANDELQLLRTKLEKIENDRNSLKTENEKLENKLSEMTVDLAEERSASNLTSERLDGETSERLKLEKELNEQHTKVKKLQEHSEKLEMELICAKSDLNGISDDEDNINDDNNGGVYKLKYERVARELEFTKRRLQTQHEHDLEQLVGLKKQLEKKLADAYEEVEEQRQVVSQWKRKAQKMTNEQNDLRMLLEEQNGRNNLLEKKQRKFDSECQALQDVSRQERQAKDRLSREKDVLIAEKFTLEQNLADTRLELDLKEEKLTALQRELEEMTFSGSTEEEIAQLRRSKNDLERRVKEQEEELDEMAGQVQLLEQAKLRLEMTLETMRKEARREAQQRDEELEEARGSAYKKLRGLECQLETEHEERTLLLREKHELERRLQMFEEQERADRQADEAVNQKLRKDLRKYKALLKDAHAQLERLKADTPGKALIRQLRNQLEDAEAARTLSMKARQTAESELTEVQNLYEEAQRAKHEAEDKATVAQRDRAELQAQMEENEEEMSELMKKYTTTVKQLNNEQNAMSEYEIRISELEAERNTLKEQIAELQARLENFENTNDPTAAVQTKRLELRAKELESRLELEQATRARLEVQANRHKDSVDKLQNEITQSKMREMTSQDALKKSQKNLRELREELHTISSREQESLNRRKDLEKKIETCEAESTSLRNDLRLALQRIADLQQAMEEGDDDITESESESSEGSLSDLEERLKPIHVKRTSINSAINGDTKIVLKQKSENSPSITVTSATSKKASLHDSLVNGESSCA